MNKEEEESNLDKKKDKILSCRGENRNKCKVSSFSNHNFLDSMISNKEQVGKLGEVNKIHEVNEKINQKEVELLIKLKKIYIKEKNLENLSDRRFSVLIGIRVNDIKTRNTCFTTPRFKKIISFVNNLNQQNRNLIFPEIFNLITERLGFELSSCEKGIAEYKFARDLLELYREVDLFIVMKDFCKIINYDFFSALRSNNRITDNTLEKIKQQLLHNFTRSQIIRLNDLIQLYKTNRPKLNLKQIDNNYIEDLREKVQFILCKTDLPNNIDTVDLQNKALKFFNNAVRMGLTYQFLLPYAHTGYVAPALVYFVLRASGIYYLKGKKISAKGIANYNPNFLKVLGLTKHTCRNIPISKIFPYFSEEIQKKIGIWDYSDYTMKDFVEKFNQIREELDFNNENYPKGRELNSLNDSYKSFVRSSYRYAGGYDNVVRTAGFNPFKKKHLQYQDYELEDFANRIKLIGKELGYVDGVCPSWNDLERNYPSLIYVLRNKDYSLSDLIPFGLIPSNEKIASTVGNLVHYIIEYEILKFLHIKNKHIKAYYEIYPNIYSGDYGRVDNAILNNFSFLQDFFNNQNVIRISEKKI